MKNSRSRMEIISNIQNNDIGDIVFDNNFNSVSSEEYSDAFYDCDDIFDDDDEVDYEEFFGNVEVEDYQLI